ncbi:MAG: metallophosphoesterase family protein [Caldisericaceae bacterium]
MKIFFAVDVHGATTVWRKWISAVGIYEADGLILAGDLTGKVLVPLIMMDDGSYKAGYFGTTWVLKTEEEIEDFERKLDNAGAYYIRATKSEVEELKNNPDRVKEIMKEKMVERMRGWLNLLTEKIDTQKIMTIVMPGNDDEFVIDPVIKEFESKGIIYPLDKVLDVEGHELISFEYVNPTPWDTAREADEGKLKTMLVDKLSLLKNPGNAIFNFHCPPINTKIDLAPKLDKNLRLVGGLDGVKYVHVGSKSVRWAIEKYQPLLGLHGHIHESSGFETIGKTLCLNPGSEYGEGLLRGYIIDITRDGVNKYWKIQG